MYERVAPTLAAFSYLSPLLSLIRTARHYKLLLACPYICTLYEKQYVVLTIASYV